MFPNSYIIERWREALLWTWLVGKIGSAAEKPGFWGLEEARIAWSDVGGKAGVDEAKILKNKDRQTLSPDRLMTILQDEESGSQDAETLRTTYIFGM